MLPVHFDLFLYVMRERNNRLFSGKYLSGSGYFLLSTGSEGGREIHPSTCECPGRPMEHRHGGIRIRGKGRGETKGRKVFFEIGIINDILGKNASRKEFPQEGRGL
ncbi:MAG: hypothetical protein LUQ67_08200 [Methanomicrobiales archaeon]|nr:hypothetical protein [Methanomicrobiales archaeon]